MIDCWLANAICIVHLLFVLFLLGGLIVIPAGIALRATWVANPWFRWLHLAASLFMVLRVCTGEACPLTQLEDTLRGDEHAARPTDVLLFRRMNHSQFAAGVLSQGIMSGLLLIVAPPRKCRSAFRPHDALKRE